MYSLYFFFNNTSIFDQIGLNTYTRDGESIFSYFRKQFHWFVLPIYRDFFAVNIYLILFCEKVCMECLLYYSFRNKSKEEPKRNLLSTCVYAVPITCCYEKKTDSQRNNFSHFYSSPKTMNIYLLIIQFKCFRIEKSME